MPLRLGGSIGSELAEILGTICPGVRMTPIAQLTQDQADLQMWLRKLTSRRIVNGRRRLVWRIDVLEEMLQFAEQCSVEVRFLFQRASDLSEHFSVKAATPEGAHSYALGLLIHRRKGWSRLIRRCEWDGCGKFFLSKPIRGGGGGEHICSAECAKAARRWSEKKSRSR